MSSTPVPESSVTGVAVITRWPLPALMRPSIGASMSLSVESPSSPARLRNTRPADTELDCSRLIAASSSATPTVCGFADGCGAASAATAAGA